jgi:L-iditol 2-dehydrogenase
VRAARLHGPGDVRVEEVPEPDGDVLVRIEAATTCGTDVKMLHHGHPVVASYPSPFGHETAGVRADTEARVLVSDSVACGGCAPCLAGRPQICRAPRWLLGAFAEAIAAPEAALHPIPEGLPAAAAAMAEPLAAAVHAVSRGSDAEDVGVIGGGPMGLMLAGLLVAEGRRVTVADRHGERRVQAEALGARGVEVLERHGLVFEAVGRPSTWRDAVLAAEPGGVVVLVGGCPKGCDATLPPGPIHYDELDLRGSFHHSPAEVDRALELLATGAFDWTVLAGPTIGLDELPAALARESARAVKWVVDPRA